MRYASVKTEKVVSGDFGLILEGARGQSSKSLPLIPVGFLVREGLNADFGLCWGDMPKRS